MENKLTKWPPAIDKPLLSPLTTKSVEINACPKCYRVCKNKSGLALHMKKCLTIENGESFLKNEKYLKVKRTETNVEKVLPSSYPLLSISFCEDEKDESERILPQNTQEEDQKKTQSHHFKEVKGNVTISADKMAPSKTNDARTAKRKPEKKEPRSASAVKLTASATNNTGKSIEASISSTDEPQCHSYATEINNAYDEIVTWRKNLFDLPKGNAGKRFVSNMNKLILAWNNKSNRRDYALKALMIMPTLLLQRTSTKSKGSLNKQHLQRRIELWENNQLSELLQESRALQKRLPKGTSKMSAEEVTKRFTNLMLLGNVKQAVRLLENDACNGVLPLTTETLQELQTKHPPGQPKFAEMLLQGPINKIDSVIFEELTSETILKAAVLTKGSAGPSLYDADDWRKILGSNIYGNEAEDLRKSLASLARELCANEVEDPKSIEALMACRLIPLDKNPGLRPIGIGETLRRILGKAVMNVLKLDVKSSVGNLQLCAGHTGGCEVGVHAVVDMFNSEDTEGVIQVDASNAFNSINRNVLLHNAKIICPEFATYIHNSYCVPARMFIVG